MLPMWGTWVIPGQGTRSPMLQLRKKMARVMKVLLAQSYPTLCDPMDCSPPGSFLCGDSPDKNTEVGCHSLLQGIFPTQGSNPGFLHCRQMLYHRNHQGSPFPSPSLLIKIAPSDHTASSRWPELPLRAQGHVPLLPS